MFQKTLDEGLAGDNVGALLRGIDRDEIERRLRGEHALREAGKAEFLNGIRHLAIRMTHWT